MSGPHDLIPTGVKDMSEQEEKNEIVTIPEQLLNAAADDYVRRMGRSALFGTAFVEGAIWAFMQLNSTERLNTRAKTPASEDDEALLDNEQVRCILHNIGNVAGECLPRWSHVGKLFGLGSGSSQKICREYGLDPDELVGVDKCEECEIRIDCSE